MRAAKWVLPLAAVIAVMLGFGAVAVNSQEGAPSAAPTEDAAAPKSAAEPRPVWQRRGCDHGHRWKSAKRGVAVLVRNHRPRVRKQRVKHYLRCVATPKQKRRVWRYVRSSREWRLEYAHKWPIKFNRLLPSWQQWAYATGGCESGNNPATATGNGYYGAFQFLPSTWWMAGGTGMPNQHSWHYQAWIAVHWRMRSSQRQWPNCAPW